MTSDGFKTQLGVRVPKGVREAAVGKASLNGESLNAYVERLIVQDVGGMPSITDPGQTSLLEPPVDPLMDDGPTILDGPPPPAPDRKPFDRACANGTYHWRHAPGNPCKYCGGEI